MMDTRTPVTLDIGGQIVEYMPGDDRSIEQAAKEVERLSNGQMTVTKNGLQIGGPIGDVMYQDIPAGYAADGWNVLEVDGHDHNALFTTLRRAVTHDVPNPDRPTAILGRTVMSKGIPFMDGQFQFHNAPITVEQWEEAMRVLSPDEEVGS